MDIEKFTQILNSTSSKLKELTAKEKENPQKALQDLQQFIPAIMEGYRQFESTSFDELKASVKTPDQRARIGSAIKIFFANIESAKKNGTIQAVLFSNPRFTEFAEKLKDLSKFLKRGERVEKVDHDAL